MNVSNHIWRFYGTFRLRSIRPEHVAMGRGGMGMGMGIGADRSS